MYTFWEKIGLFARYLVNRGYARSFSDYLYIQSLPDGKFPPQSSWKFLRRILPDPPTSCAR